MSHNIVTYNNEWYLRVGCQKQTITSIKIQLLLISLILFFFQETPEMNVQLSKTFFIVALNIFLLPCE